MELKNAWQAMVCAASLATAAWAQAPAPAKDAPTNSIAPADWLKQQPTPVFEKGHTLPPLSRFGWSLDLDTRVEFARHWGYCMEFNPGYLSDAVLDKVLADTNGVEAKALALAIREPKTYKLSVICSREMPANDKVPPETWTRDAEGHLLTGQAKSQDGTTWTPGMEAIYSPFTPDSVWQEAARLRAEPLRRLREKCPIAIVLNGGEYGLAVPGWGQKVWEKDPAIVKAKGERSWEEVSSAGIGREQTIVAEAIRQAVPDRVLYVFYSVVGNGGPGKWGPGYKDMRAASDLPGTQAYYQHFNSGWTGNQDILTHMLQAKAYEIAGGQPLSYNWLCGGWPRDKAGKDASKVSDIATYTGFLKCFYTAGMIGGNAGYYAYPPGGFAARFPPDQPPHWLLQMVALARVRAQFSHLEPYLRQGDLLPGPDPHRWSKDMPAYEFPTGDADLRVLARKLRDQPRWLLTAWAADGKAREARVTIPDLGEVTLPAPPDGAVYEATMKNGKPEVKPAAGT
jgi:hypothetical protein